MYGSLSSRGTRNDRAVRINKNTKKIYKIKYKNTQKSKKPKYRHGRVCVHVKGPCICLCARKKAQNKNGVATAYRSVLHVYGENAGVTTAERLTVKRPELSVITDNSDDFLLRQ